MIATKTPDYRTDLKPGDHVVCLVWDGQLQSVTGEVIAVDTDKFRQTRTLRVRCNDGAMREVVLRLDGPDIAGVSECRLTARAKRLPANESPQALSRHVRRCPGCGGLVKVPRVGWPCKACRERAA